MISQTTLPIVGDRWTEKTEAKFETQQEAQNFYDIFAEGSAPRAGVNWVTFTYRREQGAESPKTYTVTVVARKGIANRLAA